MRLGEVAGLCLDCCSIGEGRGKRVAEGDCSLMIGCVSPSWRSQSD
jgi:hypothetical protein